MDSPGPLTHQELLVLAAISRLVMGADARISEGELRVTDDMARRLGLSMREWRVIWDEAIRSLPNPDAIMAAARAVVRSEARELIYELVYVLASEDDIVDSEWDLLEWLDETWRSADVDPEKT